MTTWNRLEYTKLAIQSVLTQTYTDFILHIVDNGSEDGTPEYLKTLDDPRIQITLWDKNKGLSEATNFAWIGNNSKYVGRVDNDTILPADWLARMVEAHESYDNFGFIAGMHFTQKHLMDLKPNITEHNGIRIWEKPYVGGCAFLIKREDYDRFGEIGSGVMFQSRVMGLSDYQIKFSDAGKVNGYIFPFSWVDHMEHPDSPHNIKTEEYQNHSLRVRGVGVLDYGSSFDESSKYYLKLNTL